MYHILKYNVSNVFAQYCDLFLMWLWCVEMELIINWKWTELQYGWLTTEFTSDPRYAADLNKA